MKICQEIPNFVKIEQNDDLHEYINTFYFYPLFCDDYLFILYFVMVICLFIFILQHKGVSN